MKRHTNAILIRARVTEKSAVHAEREKGKVYTFEVGAQANKADVARAVKEAYGVTPRKVCVINMPRKRVVSRGRLGMQAAFRKAMVYVNDGQTIEFA